MDTNIEVETKKLKTLLSDYKEDGILRPVDEEILLQIFESPNHDFAFSIWKDELSKEDKKIFVKLLKAFGNMDSFSAWPTGKAMDYGYGALVRNLVLHFTPWWRRSIGEWIVFAIKIIIFSWLFSSLLLGILIAIVGRAFYQLVALALQIYRQNELLLRRKNSNKKPRRGQKIRENI